MKRGKEIKLNFNKNYNISSGTVDSKTPKSIYLSISAWAQPKKDGTINYDSVIKSIHKNLRGVIYDKVETEKFLKYNILDLDIRESGIKYNKRSFMNCEITLFQLNVLPINSEELLKNVRNISDVITNELDKSEFFKFHKSKNSI
jgi:hypothetical protein